MPDRIKITGLVTIKQENNILFRDIPNKWVLNGLRSLSGLFTCNSIQYQGTVCNWAGNYNMKVGTNTTTATVHNISDLIAVVNTNPNGLFGTPASKLANGNWQVTYTAIWNPGALSGTYGEVGLYFALPQGYTLNGLASSGNNVTSPVTLASRICVADGTLTEFTPDVSKTLTIEWKVQVAS